MSVIFQFLIPVFWSSKNKRVSSAYGIIDVSDDKAECIKRMTGPVKAWCVALKKNIFKIVTIHDEKEQFKKVGWSYYNNFSDNTPKIENGVGLFFNARKRWALELWGGADLFGTFWFQTSQKKNISSEF